MSLVTISIVTYCHHGQSYAKKRLQCSTLSKEKREEGKADEIY